MSPPPLPPAVTAATLLEEPDVGRLRFERTCPTGFDPLDAVLGGGLRPGELVVVGGRPGVGKTVATLQWARWMAMAGTTVVYASYDHEQRSLLARLLTMELSALVEKEDDRAVTETRRELQRISLGRCHVEEAVGPPGGLLQRTTARFRSYGDRLFLLSPGDGIGVTELRRFLETRTINGAALFVDQFRGICRPGNTGFAESPGRVAHGLKKLAMGDGVAVVAVSGTTAEGLASPRVRLHHLDGAEAFVDQSDIIVVLNEKATAVTRAHRAGHPIRARRYDQYVVVTLEKNRRGAAALDLEFRKDFTNHRFVPAGAFTEERLVEKGIGRIRTSASASMRPASNAPDHGAAESPNDGLSRQVRMADIIELTHPSPRDERQSALFKYPLDRHAATPSEAPGKAEGRFRGTGLDLLFDGGGGGI